IACHLGVLDRLGNAFAAHTRDHRHFALGFFGDNTRDARALLRGEREHFARMAVGNQAANALMRHQPLRETTQLCLVDRQVGLERNLQGREDALVNLTHDVTPLLSGRNIENQKLVLPLASCARAMSFAAARTGSSADASNSSMVARTAGAATLIAPTGWPSASSTGTAMMRRPSVKVDGASA